MPCPLPAPLQVSDFFTFGILALIWTDILDIKSGKGLSSIFALGGASTLALTLGTQDLAKRALNGLALSASDSFYVGDNIRLGDGEGTRCRGAWDVTVVVAANYRSHSCAVAVFSCHVRRNVGVRDQRGVAQYRNTM